MPSASAMQCIEFAVASPAQTPGPVIAVQVMSVSCLSVIFFAFRAPTDL